MTETDRQQVRKQATAVPVISAEQISHIGRYANAMVLACFEQMGGLPSMVDWAQQNRNDFYTKVMPKIVMRSTAVEHSGSVSIDDAILGINAIEGEYTEVKPQENWDL